MIMGKSEICRSHREAQNRAEQIQVLAELNGVSREQIIRILLDGGEDVRVTVNGKRWAEIRKMSDAQYAAALKSKMRALETGIKKKEEQYREFSMVLEGVKRWEGVKRRDGVKRQDG